VNAVLAAVFFKVRIEKFLALVRLHSPRPGLVSPTDGVEDLDDSGPPLVRQQFGIGASTKDVYFGQDERIIAAFEIDQIQLPNVVEPAVREVIQTFEPSSGNGLVDLIFSHVSPLVIQDDSERYAFQIQIVSEVAIDYSSRSKSHGRFLDVFK